MVHLWLSYTKDSLILTDWRSTNNSKYCHQHDHSHLRCSTDTIYWGWFTLCWAFHTYFLICPHKRSKGKRLKCILDEVRDYYLDLLSGTKAFPITHSFWRNGRSDLTSQTGVQALRHFVILLAYQLFRVID